MPTHYLYAFTQGHEEDLCNGKYFSHDPNSAARAGAGLMLLAALLLRIICH